MLFGFTSILIFISLFNIRYFSTYIPNFLIFSSVNNSFINTRHLYSPLTFDIGAGAGFPSIPLKIAYPSLKITIVDSLQKRTVFLNELVKTSELINKELFGTKLSSINEKLEFEIKPVIAKPLGALNKPIKENKKPKNQMIKPTKGTHERMIPKRANTNPAVPNPLDRLSFTITVV